MVGPPRRRGLVLGHGPARQGHPRREPHPAESARGPRIRAVRGPRRRHTAVPPGTPGSRSQRPGHALGEAPSAADRSTGDSGPERCVLTPQDLRRQTARLAVPRLSWWAADTHRTTRPPAPVSLVGRLISSAWVRSIFGGGGEPPLSAQPTLPKVANRVTLARPPSMQVQQLAPEHS